jgi:peptidoglycan hydrolase CwlO-like protein
LFDMENSVKLESAAALESLAVQEKEHKNCAQDLQKAREDASSLANVVSGLKLKADNRSKKAGASSEKLDRLSFELKKACNARALPRCIKKHLWHCWGAFKDKRYIYDSY